jgi:hypothetical protein
MPPAFGALALAVTFTPSIAGGGHGAALLPAIVVLLLGPSPGMVQPQQKRVGADKNMLNIRTWEPIRRV